MQPPTFDKWPKGEHARWLTFANRFGFDLMKAARDYAFEQIPEHATQEQIESAKKGALDAIYGMMMLLDGIQLNKVDDGHTVEYAVFARVREISESDQIVETVELAPDGDGLCMGIHAWLKDEYDWPVDEDFEELKHAQRQTALREAERKWAAQTKRRCPECDAPCPEYRKTC